MKLVVEYTDALPIEIQKQIEKRCLFVLKKAIKVYGKIPSLNSLLVSFKEKMGKRVASCRPFGGSVTFNVDAIKQDSSWVLNETIPHEIAHIFSEQLQLGRCHDNGWKRVCIALGGSGEIRCGSKKISGKLKARRTRKFQYFVGDIEVWVSSVRHRKIQDDGVVYLLRSNKKPLSSCGFTGKSKLE